MFTLLSLVFDHDVLKLAMHALTGDDHGLRGTALEYLDNVLPTAIRNGLWRQIGITDRKIGIGRSRREIEEILTRRSRG